ncbi:DUF3616 domain-containing protein [Candidatus Binatia bacterium]|nr:DUF3616 domain-containing protein [Candidatus Binatia bacterium]
MLLSPAAARAAAVVGKAAPLDRYPVCEPSAALAVPCSGGSGATCAWVGDNEQSASLFQYTIDDAGRLAPAEPFEISLGEAKVGDVEALASGAGGVVVMGSHSRKNSCASDSERVAVALLEGDPVHASQIAGASGFDDRTGACESRWLVLADDASQAARALRRDFCAAVAAAERDARAGDPSSCAGATLNIEGAVSVPDASGKDRLWIGLRAPLVQGLAVLLRAMPAKPGSKRLGFDGIALVDLRGKGVRELTRSAGFVWGIAGSAADGNDDSLLFRIKAERLESGNVIGETQLVASTLPPTAEGLIVQPEEHRAIVLLDGDLGKTAGSCKKKPQQLTITDLPD